ncbi:MAG: C10 family peptidase, partial [Campylobacterota bacterium]|nr:C10 family peptidase [Campylobacterota bacterium]
STPKMSSGSLSASVTPLLWMGGGSESSGINWGQGAGYNAKCPLDSRSLNDNRVAVGCVATAMGQIMRYYSSPTQGRGYHSYTDPNYGIQSADFGSTTYHWSSMPYRLSDSSSSSEIDAVATISYHAGVAVDMQYGISLSGGSGAFSDDVPDALMDYFGFLYSYIAYRDDYSAEDWNSALQNELNEGRPIYYGGGDEGSGHAFVLDGYHLSGYYHFNWGWNGVANGYFSLNSLTPDERIDFTQDQEAVFIMPHFSERKLEIVELYVATFGRASDAAGVEYWADSLLTINQIAESFYYQPETQEKYPPGTTYEEFVDTVYLNLFNRLPDPAGRDYWVAALSSGKIKASLFILALINGAQDTDAVILANKTSVGEYYAFNELNDAALATLVMSDIDETEQSVEDAFEIIDDAVGSN